MEWDARVTKSRSEIAKEKRTMYKSSFGDLKPGTIYRDPAGFKTPNGAELQKEFWDALSSKTIPALEKYVSDGEAPTVVNAWNSLQRKNYSIEDTTDEIRKSLDTGDWTLPLDILPEVFVINPEQTPMADLMTRVATQDDEIVATPVQDDIEPSFGLEDPNVATNGEGDYVYDTDQPTYGDLRYDVFGLGAATRISDKMILASANLRNASATQEQSLVRGMRQKMERQIIHGTDSAEGGDANGFDGFNDIGSVIADLGDPANLSDADIEDYTRQAIDEVEYQGAPRGNVAVVCGFDWHKRLRDSLITDVRYESGEDEAATFTNLQFDDDVPVYKSHAFTRLSDLGASTTAAPIYAVNMDATYLGMLQETSLQPLARLGPQERMAVDNYGALVAEAPSHIQSYTVTTPA